MVYIRIKKIKGNDYAYLVENTWMKKTKRPKQKVKAYLGRFLKGELQYEKGFIEHYRISNLDKYFSSNSINKVIKDLIELEFLKHGLFDIKVNMDEKKIHREGNKVVLGINGGHLCDHTLKKLVNFKFTEQEELGYGLAKAFSDAGINVPKVVFVEVFNKMVGG